MLYFGPFVVTREEDRLRRESAYCQTSWVQHFSKWVIGSPEYPRRHQLSAFFCGKMTTAFT